MLRFFFWKWFWILIRISNRPKGKMLFVDCFIQNGFNVITLHANTGYTSNFARQLTLQLEEVLNTSVNTMKINFKKNRYNLLLLKWNACLNLKFGKFKHKRFYKIITIKIQSWKTFLVMSLACWGMFPWNLLFFVLKFKLQMKNNH